MLTQSKGFREIDGKWHNVGPCFDELGGQDEYQVIHHRSPDYPQ